jgi:hypothetical protein
VQQLWQRLRLWWQLKQQQLQRRRMKRSLQDSSNSSSRNSHRHLNTTTSQSSKGLAAGTRSYMTAAAAQALLPWLHPLHGLPAGAEEGQPQAPTLCGSPQQQQGR